MVIVTILPIFTTIASPLTPSSLKSGFPLLGRSPRSRNEDQVCICSRPIDPLVCVTVCVCVCVRVLSFSVRSDTETAAGEAQ